MLNKPCQYYFNISNVTPGFFYTFQPDIFVVCLYQMTNTLNLSLLLFLSVLLIYYLCLATYLFFSLAIVIKPTRDPEHITARM